MTTRIRKPVAREVPGTRYTADLIVTLAPEGIYFREKGRRKKYLQPYGIGYLVAARLFADAERKRKKAEREERKKQKQAVAW